MCGRYVLALRYGQVHDVLEQHGLPADDFHEQHRRINEANGADDARRGQEDDEAEEEQDDGAQDADDARNTGDAIFQPSYNFAPGYRGVVLRPVFPSSPSDNSNKPEEKGGKEDGGDELHLQLQVMKWGLVPSWMKKRPDYATMLKTINCRADSLAAGSGMWAGLRGRKRCVVVAQGFYEWLKTGPNDKERVPHYIRRRDGLPLLLAGLWDRSFAGGDDKKSEESEESQKSQKSEPVYTYTIITTDSNASLRFLHDRMPVVFDYGSPELQKWLDPARDTWTPELQALLRPWSRMAEDDDGALLIDVVSKDVNKAGHSSPRFIVPVASESNKANIANFFRGGGKTEKTEKKGKREGEAHEIDEQPSKRTRLTLPSTDSISPEKVTAEAEAATTATPTTPVKNMVSTRPASVSSASKESKKITGKEGHEKGNKGVKTTARTPTKKEKDQKDQKDDKSGNGQKITSFFGLKNG